MFFGNFFIILIKIVGISFIVIISTIVIIIGIMLLLTYGKKMTKLFKWGGDVFRAIPKRKQDFYNDVFSLASAPMKIRKS